MADPDYADMARQIGKYKTDYIRPELLGGLSTPAWAALMQMFDPKGLSPAQLDRNAAMRGPLLREGFQRQPEALGQERLPARPGAASPQEDLNSVLIKYNNWRKQQTGQELTPQERVTQGFIDVRNPNSWY
jgi:hypothetical protein